MNYYLTINIKYHNESTALERSVINYRCVCWRRWWGGGGCLDLGLGGNRLCFGNNFNTFIDNIKMFIPLKYKAQDAFVYIIDYPNAEAFTSPHLLKSIRLENLYFWTLETVLRIRGSEMTLRFPAMTCPTAG